MESFAKLRWRCRRGIKELDCLLEAYLDNHYEQASKEDRILFVKLLSLQNPQLTLFLSGKELPQSLGLKEIVKQIRNYPYI